MALNLKHAGPAEISSLGAHSSDRSPNLSSLLRHVQTEKPDGWKLTSSRFFCVSTVGAAWEVASHRGRGLAAPPAAPAVRTCTYSSPAGSPPPCKEQKAPVNVRITPSRPPMPLDETEQAGFKGFTGCQASQRVVQDVKHIRLPAGVLVRHTPPPTQPRSNELTPPGASSTSDRGRTGSRTAPGRTAPPAADTQDPLGPTSAAQPRNTRQVACHTAGPGRARLCLDPLPTCHKQSIPVP